jgi:predicted transcriptional regulator
MQSKIPGLTRLQRNNVEQFLNLFAEVEKVLKKRLHRRINDTMAASTLINDYAARNPFWANSADRLRNLAEIRNLLTHQRSLAHGYPIAVTHLSLVALREIKDHLDQPEPVSARYRTNVKTLSAKDSLAVVLALAFENGFSQFPIVDEEQFGGLITETEITRWLGRRVKANALEVDLRTVTVKNVLKEKDPTSKGIAIFHFNRLEAPLEEAMGMFATEPMLEAILLSRSGSKHTPIEGIITQWDAARYQN